ncbi:MAG: phosphatase NudJ [Candidatus Paceibacteria bacterium]|jgi:phosphatase NudJ
MNKTKISTSCVIEHEGKILMIQEEQNGKISWDIPAGGLDTGETIFQGIKREVLEETGITLLADPVHKRFFQYIETDKTTINFLFFIELESLPETHSNNQGTDEDIINIDWFDKEAVIKMINTDSTENNLATARLRTWVDGFTNIEISVISE